MNDQHSKPHEEEVEEEESESGIDDSMLDEISEDAGTVEEPEGFGHLKEDGSEDEEEVEESEAEEDTQLEEDAEDVDYDSFDDEDHL